MEFAGWFGNVLLMLCGVPLAWRAHQLKKDIGANELFLHMWFWGEVFSWMYVAMKFGYDGPLWFNYSLNIVSISIVGYYKYFGVNNEKD